MPVLVKFVLEPFRELQARFVRFQEVWNVYWQLRLSARASMRTGLLEVRLVDNSPVVNVNVSGGLQLNVLVEGGALQ